jgi:hypothetical protein
MSKHPKQPTRALILLISLVAAPLGGVLGEEPAVPQEPAAPMMQKGPGGMMPGGPGRMGMMNPQMRMQRQQMRQEHMARMEGYLANIEALLRELVELNKAQAKTP